MYVTETTEKNESKFSEKAMPLRQTVFLFCFFLFCYFHIRWGKLLGLILRVICVMSYLGRQEASSSSS